jgi:hypothetical protein
MKVFYNRSGYVSTVLDSAQERSKINKMVASLSIHLLIPNNLEDEFPGNVIFRVGCDCRFWRVLITSESDIVTCVGKFHISCYFRHHEQPVYETLVENN